MSKVGTDISIVIPLYNEEEIIFELYERLKSVLETEGLTYEIIFVDDGSRDASLAMVKALNVQNPLVKVLSFSRNFGHQTAVSAGLYYAAGAAVMVMDGDLQDPPELIPKFIEKHKSGYAVVYAVREKRKEGIVKKSLYTAYYRLLRKISNIDIPLDSGDFCLMDQRVVTVLNSLPERNRFVRGLRSWVGFKQTALAYERDKRYAGKSKYGFLKLIQLGLDGIISFSDIPLKISIVIGLLISLASILYSFFIIIDKVWLPSIKIPGWASLIVAITFIGGIQLTVTGILGEYVLRIFYEVKKRPHYVLSEVIGFNDEHPKGIGNNTGI